MGLDIPYVLASPRLAARLIALCNLLLLVA